jgi:DNA-directed RNA polymerase subunit K/omega
MTIEYDSVQGSEDLFLQACAIAATVYALRRAQGKQLPRDLEHGTAQWQTAMEEFAQDVIRVLPASA